MGVSSLRVNTSGGNNVALGTNALTANTTASNNTAVGYNVGVAVTTGANNQLFGQGAGSTLTTGANNTLVGTLAGSYDGTDITTGTRNHLFGNFTKVAAAASADAIVIGYYITSKGNQTGFISPGGGPVYQGNNSSTWSTTSDRRLKKNIVDSAIGLAEINQLQVRNFEYRTVDEVTELEDHTVIDKSGVQVGVIAQEIQAILPNCVKEESTGVLSVDSDNLTWHLIKAVQELSATNDALAARITALEG